VGTEERLLSESLELSLYVGMVAGCQQRRFFKKRLFYCKGDLKEGATQAPDLVGNPKYIYKQDKHRKEVLT
jgi:hypothetical protein